MSKKKSQWVCRLIECKLHALDDQDYSNVLAELWELLIKQSYPVPNVLEPAKIHSSELVKPKRSYRR
nr:hypothetical protein HAGR004_19500 [Bdellovibrio sp. HAGR004]